MGRRPRRAQYERCRPADPRASGKALAWLVVCVVTAWQAAVPSLCPGGAIGLVASDGGWDVELPPIPETLWVDSGIAGEAVPLGGPSPIPGQKPGPCEAGMTEMRGYCWYELKERAPLCPRGSVAWAGRCWVPVNGALTSPPVAGGE